MRVASTLLALALFAGASRPAVAQDFPPPEPAVETSPPGDACPTPFLTARKPTPWFADAETAVLFRAFHHVNDHFDRIDRDLETIAVSPRVYLGYRFESGDAIRFSYRNLTEWQLQQDRTGYAKSDRGLNVNWFDLDLVTREFAPLTCWRIQAELGGRFVYNHQWYDIDSDWANSEFRSDYFGGGPHVALTSNLLMGESGWSLYGRADAAITFGGVWNKQTTVYRPPYDYLGNDDWTSSSSAAQLDVDLQLALMKRWQTERCGFGFGVGVQADLLTMFRWDEDNSGSFGLGYVGPFVRFEADF
jgi:hypothetical protein